MKIVIFGLTLSSSWGNGHATLWRGLVRALARSGHDVMFFERDVPYYAAHRDLTAIPGAQLVLYGDWRGVYEQARHHVGAADVLIVTSYCEDAVAASRLGWEVSRPPLCVFYDMDTPVTLARMRAGERVAYLPPEGLAAFDLVLSYAGGETLGALRQALGARRVAPLYGHVDPEAHRAVARGAASPSGNGGRPRFDLSYLGTYASDRQPALRRLFIDAARAQPGRQFLLGGSGYPADFPWTANISFVHHVPPPRHAEFYASSRLTLNITRADMAASGFCPSGRLFEAAACGVPLLSDAWRGLERFFVPGKEILIVRSTPDVEDALALPDSELSRIAQAARERVLAEHTSAHRAAELVRLLEETLHERRSAKDWAVPEGRHGSAAAAAVGRV
jgi:spore maturation protein CgeB